MLELGYELKQTKLENRDYSSGDEKSSKHHMYTASTIDDWISKNPQPFGGEECMSQNNFPLTNSKLITTAEATSN